MNTLLITQLILAVTISTHILLILFVLYQNTRPFMNKVLLIQMVCILGWVCCIFANTWLESKFIEHWVFAFAAAALIALLHFVFLYPDSHPLPLWAKQLLGFSLGFGYVFVGASFIPGAIFTSIDVTSEGYTIVEPGWFSSAYAGFVLTYILGAIFVLLYKLLKFRQQGMSLLTDQTTYLLYGFVLFFFTNLLTNSLLPVLFDIYFFNGIGPVFSVILDALIVYIVFRFHFLQIRSIVQRGLIYTFLFGLVVSFYLGSTSLIHFLFGSQLQMTAITAGAITTIIGIFTIPPLDHFFRKVTHPFFFKGQFDYSETLYDLSEILNRTLNVQTIITATTEKLSHIFGAQKVSIVLSEQGEVDNVYELSFPLTTTNGTVGQLLLGSKRSGEEYAHESKQMLSTLANQIAIAIERARLYETVREYNEELEKKVALRTKELESLQQYQKQMIAELSHGLQIPLTTIINELETLDPAQQPNLKPFKHSVDLLTSFIQNLLRLTKLEAPSMRSPKVQFDLSALLGEIAEYTQVSFAQQNIELMIDIIPNVHIRGNAKELTEAVHTLLYNTVRYRDPVRTQRVAIILERKRKSAVIRIKDTGIGIPKVHLPYIFKRFYRIREGAHADIEGTGLGLAIVEAIIRDHGGSISVESELNVYSEFTLVLPVNTV